jgi:hypothetical protein
VSGGSFSFQENIGTHEVCIIGTCVANEGDVIQSHVGDSRLTKALQAFPNKGGADTRERRAAYSLSVNGSYRQPIIIDYKNNRRSCKSAKFNLM